MYSSSALKGRILVVAFEGWNDAGEAASSAVSVLRDELELVELASFDSESLFDYQLVRPRLAFDDAGVRELIWPQVTLFAPSVPAARPTALALDADLDITGANASNIYLLCGPEPSRNWKTLSRDIVDLLLAADIEAVIFLGSLLADVPHTRPISIFASSENPEVRQVLELEKSTYEGPTGILSVLAQGCESVGISTVSLWASVPHYVHHTPSPKATLALIDRIEELIDFTIPRADLLRESQEWEANIDALAAQDDEMAAYIQSLEVARDESASPTASGEALAREFEKFLRTQDEEDQGPSSTDQSEG